jgi:hypothetical protein
VHLGFLLSKKRPRTIQEAYHMAIQIEANISLFKGEHLFTPETKVDDPKDAPDALSLERLVSLEIFVNKFWKEGNKSSTNKRLRRRILMKVSNPMRKRKNLLMLLPRIMRTWLKSESLKISNMMMKY